MQKTNQSSNSRSLSILLRLEGLAMFALTVYLYHYFHGCWWLFVAAFFVPDLSLLGYLFGSRIGAIVYNIFHTEIGPVLLAGLGLLFDVSLILKLALIWISHISFDRMLGIGLKYSDGFKHTHLGSIKLWK
jgi:hypothetical protein